MDAYNRLCIAILLRDFWKRLPDKSLTNFQLVKDFMVQAIILSVIPTVIYMGAFYIHLKILTKAGVHDSLMTSAFQVLETTDTSAFHVDDDDHS